jgi:alpha-tubulin suppressor-like RCC1 family protein
MALTESGRVFSWGDNSDGQLSHNNINDSSWRLFLPLVKFIGIQNNTKYVKLSNKISIKKISCGWHHSLLLSQNGDIYWFGSNGFEREMTPNKLTINTNKLIDIASHPFHNISIALSINGM